MGPSPTKESLPSILTFSSDPIQDASRRAAFDKLLSTVASYEGEIVPDSLAQQQEGPNVVHVNSLVFEVTGSEPILLIVPNTDNVDTTKVEEVLEAGDERLTVRLAPADVVELVCGFPPGSVPPLGHSPTSLRTIVDEQLLNVDMLWGGGGHPEYSSLIKTEMLMNLKHVDTADIVARPDNNDKRKANDAVYGSVLNGGSTFAQQSPPKPFFPVAPPPIAVAEDCCSDQDAPNPLKPTPVTVVGRITGVRQMARRLVFADFAPADHPLDSKDDYPWKSGLDGLDMAVQLIAGKTLCKTLGDVAGPAALRRLKRGQLVLIKGKTNVGNRDSLRNWVEKRSLDIVIFSYQQLEEGPPVLEALSSNIQSNAELRRLQLAASVPPALPTPAQRPPSPRPKSETSSYLTLNDVFPTPDGVPPVTVVDSLEAVNDFANKISQLLLSLTTSNVNGDTEPRTVPGMDKVGLIGMDCEWRPSFLADFPSQPQPILLLQISIQPLKEVFLFDAQALFRPLKNPSEQMTELEAAASQTLEDMFTSQRLLKVGFQLGADLRRLASSYPHIPAFRMFNAVVEVATLAKKAMQLRKERNSKYHTTSLSRVTEFLLGKTIDKHEQVSDWSVRPMSEEQIEYAALDAAVSPVLLEKSLQMAEAGVITEDASRSSSFLQLGRWEDDTMFTGSVMSWRFLLLDTNDPAAIRKLKAKRIVGEPYVVTQRWHTGGKPPMHPSVPSRSGEGPYTDVSGVFRMPSKLVRITAGKDATILVDHLVGERVGRSKEKCVDSLLTGEAALPDKAKIEFHQRSGYVEFADGVALFVNMPDKSYKRGYPNEWLEDGKFLTWYLRKHEWDSGTSALAQKLMHTDADEPSVPLLFVRMAKGMFLCCGRCRAVVPESSVPEDETVEGVSKVGDWGLIQLQLELLDQEKLQHSTDFVTMVHNWLGNGRDASADGDSDGLEAEIAAATDPPATREDSNLTKMHILAEMVLAGNIVGALSLALKQADVPLEERSVVVGFETLKRELAKNASDDSTRALELITNMNSDNDST